MNGTEHYLDGGIYDHPEGETRADVYLKESGPSPNDGSPIPLSFELVIVTGNAVFSLTEISPPDIIRLGKWLVSVGNRKQKEDAYHGTQDHGKGN